ncbi:MAG: 6-pyruvoyl trahydropterin synthase family protein [Longimicrobiales bacterium]
MSNSRPHVRVTRHLHFSAAHRLAREDWSDEQNQSVFGDCAHPNWHGHNYELEITVAGPVDPETGFVMDLKALKDLVNARVIDDLDHKNLNLDVPWLSEVLPSTENVVVKIWERLAPVIPGEATLSRLVLRETPRHCAEYEGE